jgi:hypothetical protein
VVLMLDFAGSLILLALFWWMSHPRTGGDWDYLGVVYVSAVVCKAAELSLPQPFQRFFFLAPN